MSRRPLTAASRRRLIRLLVLPPLLAWAAWMIYGFAGAALAERRPPLLASAIAAALVFAVVGVLNDVTLDGPEVPRRLALLAFLPLARLLLEGPSGLRASLDSEPLKFGIHLTLALLCALVAGPVAIHIHRRSRPGLALGIASPPAEGA